MTTHTPQITYLLMKEKLTNTQPIQIQALACCLYGFMCRISEIVGNKQAKQQGLTKTSLQVEETVDKKLLSAIIWNEKQKNPYAEKSAYININREAWLTQPILDWKEQSPTEQLFPFSRVHAYKLIKEKFEWHTHYFRKARANHYLKGEVTGRPENLDTVRKLGGWSSKRTMLEKYSEVSIMDIKNMV